MIKYYKYLSRSFSYIFFSVNRGETRVFPSQAAAHSGKKAGFLSRVNIEKLCAEKPGFFLHRRRLIPEKKPGFFPVRISKTYG
ncbi:Uncharacterized protein dnm_030740 [Desulfonema magnum]|uniref:Uncharacterized protein n=1 Tax=Desulfonema magnum TaxID=45655 RepID=A0A975BKN2_9BACT|nr:Uncharacterized protein dnm_030740 [Desulfonema magnum]